MTNTRDKLSEAKHFLEGMRRVSSDPDKFRYELTAFLAASRSITLIMQKEFARKFGFADWYIQKQNYMKREPTLKYLHRQRNISHHEHPVLSYSPRAIGQSCDYSGVHVVLTGTGSNLNLDSFVDLPSSPIMPPDTTIKYYFDDIPNKDKDVILICQEAINVLEKIVGDCEDKFC